MQENKGNNKDMVTVPYFVYESAEARSERCSKRLIIALIISIIVTFLSNALWLYAWFQYDYVTETTDVTIEGENDGGGNANYIGDNSHYNYFGQEGEVNDGEDKSDKDKNNEDIKDGGTP